MKLTPKQKVLRKYPEAHCCRYAGDTPYVVYSGSVRVVRGKRQPTYSAALNVSDVSARKAWAAAARRLKGSP